MADDVTSIELKDLLDFIPVGTLEDVKDLAGFKTKFNEAKYIKLEDAHNNKDVFEKMRPTVLKGYDEVLKKRFKGLNNFSETDYDKIEKSVDKAAYLGGLLDAETKELKDRVSDTNTPSERETELQNQLKSLQQAWKQVAPIEDVAAFDGLTPVNQADKIRGYYEQHEETALNELKQTHTKERVSNETSKLFANLNYSDQFSPYAKTGFEVEVNKKFNFAFDNDRLVVTNKEGNQIQNPDKHGEFLSPLEIMNSELKEGKGLKSNGVPDGGTPVPNPNPPPDDGVKRIPLTKAQQEAADNEDVLMKRAKEAAD